MRLLSLLAATVIIASDVTHGQVNFPGAGAGSGAIGGGGFPAGNTRPIRPNFPPATPNRRPGGFPVGSGGGVPFGGLGSGGSAGVAFPGGANSGVSGGVPSQQFSVACTDFNGSPGECVPAVTCSRFFQTISTQNGASCSLGDGAVGVCCPSVGSFAGAGTAASPGIGSGNRVFTSPVRDVQIRQFSPTEINTAGVAGQGTLNQILEIETRLKASGGSISKGSPSSYHQSFFKVSPNALLLARAALAGIETSRQLVRQNGLNALEGGYGLQKFQLGNTNLGSSFCPALPDCRNYARSPYRSMDGSCNNFNQPTWGQALTAMQRILPPTYNDGIWEPRTFSVTGRPLPSARFVSSRAFDGSDRPDDHLTLLVMQWGQFLDHDLTHAGVFKLDAQANTGILCCRNGNPIIPSPHPACMPIEIPASDPFYARHGQRCMEFVRSLPAPRPGCTLGFAEQMNQITAFIDASNVYGSTDEEARELRLFRNGQLQFLGTRGSRPLLPLSDKEGDDCTDLNRDVRCYRAGDDRVNEQAGLTLMHTIWMREHNRVAAELQTLNPGWSDEQLYQEARKIVGAEMQHITYNEWLPLVLGPRYMANFRLYPQRFGYSRDYDPSVNPSITNEFATAAFRFGHTLVQKHFQLLEAGSGQPNQVLELRNLFNNPSILNSPSAVDSMTRGLTLQPMQSYDNSITEELQNHLFRKHNAFGLDLMSLNIQRGRDHGLPTYNDMRELCGLGRASSFFDLARDMPQDAIARMQSIYASVDDVDLWVGGISENSLPEAILGPTFTCIIGDMFTRLKRGDRYFYEFVGQSGSFSEAQLNEIKKVSFARILCDNTDVGEMQPLAFIRPSSRLNNKHPCTSPNIPRMGLFAWSGRGF